MNPSVKSVSTIEGYKLILVFENGKRRLFDVSPYLNKGIFSELKDPSYFNQVRASFGAVEWPHQQDFSKDTLYLLSTPQTI